MAYHMTDDEIELVRELAKRKVPLGLITIRDVEKKHGMTLTVPKLLATIDKLKRERDALAQKLDNINDNDLPAVGTKVRVTDDAVSCAPRFLTDGDHPGHVVFYAKANAAAGRDTLVTQVYPKYGLVVVTASKAYVRPQDLAPRGEA
jgi:hypothetical protein